MSKVRVFENPDGTVKILHPNWNKKNPNETEEEFMGRIVAKTKIGDGVYLKDLPYMDIEKEQLPKNRSNRNSWKLNRSGKKVDDK